MSIQQIIESKKIKIILWILGVCVAILLVFKAGEYIGFHKAEFSYRWGERYYRNFADSHSRLPLGLGERDSLMGHGTFGSVIKIASSTLVIQDAEGVEKIIAITPQTEVRKFRDKVSLSDLKINDRLIIIGMPNTNGEIEARLVRIMPQDEMPFPPASSTRP